MVDYNEIKDLISRVDASGFLEFELKLDNAHVRMSKTGMGSRTVMEDSPVAPVAVVPVAAPGVPPAIDTPITLLPPEKTEALTGDWVTAPIVGTFYESSAPGKPAFAKVGSTVKTGDVLCIVEAMKVMNEIVSPRDGKVAEIAVKNEDMVEFGQKLFRIE